MAQAELVNEDVLAGKWLVEAADRNHVPVRGALWLYNGDDERWTLVLEATPGEELRPLDFAQRLHDAVATIADARQRDAARQLLLGSVQLYTRPNPVAQLLRPSLGQAGSVSGTRLRNTAVGNYLVEGALLYRLEPSQAV